MTILYALLLITTDSPFIRSILFQGIYDRVSEYNSDTLAFYSRFGDGIFRSLQQ